MANDDGTEIGRVLMWIGLGLLAVLLLGYPFGYMDGGYDSWEGVFAGFIFLVYFFPIVVIGLIIVLVVSLANGSRRNTPAAAQPMAPTGSNPESVAILDRRYAAGELDRAEYLRMRRDLSGRN